MNIARTIIRTLLIWLLIHFVVLTWLEYRMGLTGSLLTVIALWKEIVVVGRAARLWIQHHKQIITLWKSDMVFRIITLVLFATIAITMVVSAWWWYLLSSYIAAFKYNLIGFGVGWLAYISGTMMTRWDSRQINRQYVTVIKRVLVLSVVWYAAIVIKPWVLKYLWYSKTTYEWSLDGQPPAVYYSEMTSGIQRNQFVFERPITYWFWLVAFWPIFFVIVLRRKPIAESWFWWLMFAMAVILTFSRAAWWAWLLQLAILWYWTYQSSFRKFVDKILLPAIIVIAWVSYLWFHQIFGGGRQFSNTWHINALITSVHAIQDHWLLWRGPGSVGPASHHFWLWYNTENQFLQVRIEYGLVWFLWRLILFGAMIAWGVWLRARGGKTDKQSDYLIAYSIGMIWLAVSGLVLHSWVDRMIVWPVVLLIGMSWGVYTQDRGKR
jgi:hypothetical protein